MNALEGKVVIITGAKGGLGTFVTEAFLAAGARVAGVSRSIQASDFPHPEFTAVPAELSAVIGWLMNKRPEERPQSAEMVADELETWAEPAMPTATRVSYDTAWEATMLERVETAWIAHRPPAEEVEVLTPDEE